MDRVVTLFLLGLGMVLLALGMVLAPKTPWSLLLLLPGAVALYMSVVRDTRWEKTVEVQRKVKTQERVRELTITPWKEGEVMSVKSDSYLWFITLAIAGVMWMAGADKKDPILGILSILLALIALFQLRIGFGKPRLELDSEGFYTPLHGNIAWCEVNDIVLEKYRSGRGTINYLMRFTLENYARAVTTVPLSMKLLALFGLGSLRVNRVSVYMGNDGKEPEQETIYEVARYLWQQSRLDQKARQA
jgi:hypothetical protein